MPLRFTVACTNGRGTLSYLTSEAPLTEAEPLACRSICVDWYYNATFTRSILYVFQVSFIGNSSTHPKLHGPSGTNEVNSSPCETETCSICTYSEKYGKNVQHTNCHAIRAESEEKAHDPASRFASNPCISRLLSTTINYYPYSSEMDQQRPETQAPIPFQPIQLTENRETSCLTIFSILNLEKTTTAHDMTYSNLIFDYY